MCCGVTLYRCRLADDNLTGALTLLDEIEAKVGSLPDRPKAYQIGRVAETREMLVRPNYVVIYADVGEMLVILRVLHAAQMWP